MTTPAKSPLSDEWRMDPSQLKALDLANVLRSLKKMIGSVSPNKEVSVAYGNEGQQSSFSHNLMAITINPKWALASTPVSGEHFDILAGESVHEALHDLCDSEDALPRRFSAKVTQEVSRQLSTLIANVHRIGEEIYVDNFGKRNYPVLGQYIHRSREGNKADYDADSVDWNNLFNTWIAIAVYGILPPAEAYDIPNRLPQIQLLMELTSQLTQQDFTPSQRQGLYFTISERLLALIQKSNIQQKLAPPPPLELETNHITNVVIPDDVKEKLKAQSEVQDSQEEKEQNDGNIGNGSDESDGIDALDKLDKSYDIQDSDDNEEKVPTHNTKGKDDASNSDPEDLDNDMEEGNEDDEEEEIFSGTDKPIVSLQDTLHPEITQLPSALAAAIEEIFQSDTQDITDLVESTFSIRTPTIVWSKAQTQIDTEFNTDLANQLRWLKEFKNTIGHQIYRREPRGRIDTQNIHRALIDGHIFKTKRILPKSDLDLVLLLDCSGSMGNRQKLYDDAKALFKTLPETIVLSYSNTDKGVTITRQTEGSIFRKISIAGDTPSGLALAATAAKYPKSLIIHFTDGGSNVGIEPNEIIPKIHEQFPIVKMIHVHLEKSSSPYKDVEGVSSSIILPSISDFPEKLKEALKSWR